MSIECSWKIILEVGWYTSIAMNANSFVYRMLITKNTDTVKAIRSCLYPDIWESARLQPNARLSKPSGAICRSSWEDRKLKYSYHNAAAASTMPVALKVLGLVTTISTGYFHSMNLAQPSIQLADWESSPTLFGCLPSLTPICDLSANVLPNVWHDKYCE